MKKGIARRRKYHYQLCSLWVLLPPLGASASFCLIHWPVQINLNIHNKPKAEDAVMEIFFIWMRKAGIGEKAVKHRLKKLKMIKSPTRFSAKASIFPKDSNLVKSAPRPVITMLTEATYFTKSKSMNLKLKQQMHCACLIFTIWSRIILRVECNKRPNSLSFSCSYLPICKYINNSSTLCYGVCKWNMLGVGESRSIAN